MSRSRYAPDTHRKTDWRKTAACLKEDPELFFPKGYEGPWQLVVEQAKAICRHCPVSDACLQFALNNAIPAGIFGGLTEAERVGLRRSTQRRGLSAEDAAKKAEHARQPQKPRTLRAIFDDNTDRLPDGHLKWTGGEKVNFRGRAYTPRQAAFIVDRGRYAAGRVLVECTVSECVLPAHLTDQEERGWCGTRNGYRRHHKNGEKACVPCRKANAEADRRLRNTGATKVAV